MLTNCCNFTSSITLGVETCFVCSSIIGCCNSSSSTCLDARTCFNYSSTTCSFEYEITITCGVGVALEVVVILRKLRVAFNSLFPCTCSKILISYVLGACKASGFT